MGYRALRLVLVTVLLSYNSHTRQLIHLNCTVQWVLEYPECALITTIVLEHLTSTKGYI